MTTVTVYGYGGMDPSKPNNNIIEEYEVEPSPEDEARQSAIAKLQALGLTEEEAMALVSI